MRSRSLASASRVAHGGSIMFVLFISSLFTRTGTSLTSESPQNRKSGGPSEVASSSHLPGTPNSEGSTPSLKACLQRNGLAYGPFRDGEGPGSPLPFPSRAQMDEDLAFLSQVTSHVRTYGSGSRYGDVPPLAEGHSLRVMLGIHLTTDDKANKKEIDSAASLVHEEEQKGESVIDSIIVGNENLSNSGDNTLSGSDGRELQAQKEKLIAYIGQVRDKIYPSKIPVSTAQVASVWESNPDLAAKVDFVTAHFYPFWDRLPIEGAAASVIERYRRLQLTTRAKLGKDVRIVIGETGWPSSGASLGKAVPSRDNQRKYLQEFMKSACDNSIQFYYFEAFDEEWKWQEGGSEEWEQLQGERKLRPSDLPFDRTFSGKWIGSSWGIFQSDGKLKSQLADLLEQPPIGSRVNREIFARSSLSGYYDMGVDSWPDRKHDWVSSTDQGGGGELRLAYPADQNAGAVFMTVGEPAQPPRPWKDFSDFRTLEIEMRGENGGEKVEIGVKHRTDPDNGNEKRAIETLTAEFVTYSVPLSALQSGHLRIPEGLKQLNVAVEFVFHGPRAQTIYVRNIRYEPK